MRALVAVLVYARAERTFAVATCQSDFDDGGYSNYLCDANRVVRRGPFGEPRNPARAAGDTWKWQTAYHPADSGLYMHIPDGTSKVATTSTQSPLRLPKYVGALGHPSLTLALDESLHSAKIPPSRMRWSSVREPNPVAACPHHFG